MKKFNIIKTVQLIVMLIFLIVCTVLVLTNKGLFHDIATHPGLKLTAALLWLSFGLNFLFFFLDVRFVADYKRDYRELDFAVHSDPLSGLANRNSCDAIIELYQDKPLPPGIGCAMLELQSIRQINERLGHAKGNEVIRDFSTILKMSSVSLCFVGRNGGNKFLAIFEESSREDMERFLDRVARKVAAYNEKHPQHPIVYGCGTAFEEPMELKINELVALSNARIHHN